MSSTVVSILHAALKLQTKEIPGKVIRFYATPERLAPAEALFDMKELIQKLEALTVVPRKIWMVARASSEDVETLDVCHLSQEAAQRAAEKELRTLRGEDLDAKDLPPIYWEPEGARGDLKTIDAATDSTFYVTSIQVAQE